MLQLRILMGLNAGAACDLADGAYTIGTSEDCDLVLADGRIAPHHLTLIVAGGEVQVEAVGGALRHAGGELAPGQRAGMAAFTPFMIGATAMAVGAGDWPAIDLDALRPPDQAPAGGESAGNGEAAAPGTGEEATPAAPAGGEAEDAAGPAPEPKVKDRGGLVLAAVIVVLVVAGLGASAYLMLSPPGTGKSEMASLDPVERVRAAVKGMEGHEKLKISRLGTGRVLIEGILPERRHVTAMREKLRGVPVPVTLRILATEELLRSVGSFLQNLDTPLAAFVMEDTGRVGIRGFLPSQREVDMLKQLLDRDLPGAPVSYDAIETSDTIRQAFAGRLREAGLGAAVRVGGNGNKLALTGMLASVAQREALDRVVEAARQDWGRFVSIGDEVQVVKAITPMAESMAAPKPLAMTEVLGPVDPIEVPRRPVPKAVPDPDKARVIQPRSAASGAEAGGRRGGPVARAAGSDLTFTVIVAGELRFARDDQGRRFQIGDTLPDGFVIIDIGPGVVTARKADTEKRFEFGQ